MTDETTPPPADPRDPLYAPAEIRPPVPEANSFGGGLDAADSPPPNPDEPGRGSAHDDDGWRAIDIAKP